MSIDSIGVLRYPCKTVGMLKKLTKLFASSSSSERQSRGSHGTAPARQGTVSRPAREGLLSGLPETRPPAAVRAKDTPYYSSKRDPNISFNPTAMPAVEGAKAQRATCRHLSVGWIDNPDFLEVAQSAESIRHYFSAPETSLDRAEQRYASALHTDEAFKRCVGNAQFGQWLADTSTDLVASGRTQTTALVLTLEHAMALRMQRKTDADGSERICVTCYDPNRTSAHLRFEAATPQQLNARSLAECFGPEYFSDTASLFCTIVGQDLATTRPVLSYAPPHTDFATLAQLATHALATGQSSTVGAVLMLLASAGVNGADATAVLLNCRHRKSGAPGFALAMQEGHGQAVSAFMSGLPALGLAGAHAWPLLDAKRQDGVTGLMTAMQRNHAQAVAAWLDGLHAVGIFGADAAALLGSALPNGATAHYLAFQFGNTDAVEAWLARLPALGIQGREAAALLGAPRPTGWTPLIAAMSGGHADTVRAFLESLPYMGLSREQIASLLDAQARSGATGLTLATAKGHTAAVDVFLAGRQALLDPYRISAA